jgi:hypothetical protein
MILYIFPICWIISIFFGLMFIIVLRKAEKKYNIVLVRILGRNYPGSRTIKQFINKTTVPEIKRKYKQILSYYYLIYIMFILPILIVIIDSIL